MHGSVFDRARWAALAVVVLLGGCFLDDDSDSSAQPPNVSGTVTFDFVPTTVTGAKAALNYAGTTALPARGIVVEALDANTQAVLATTTTDAAGGYSFVLPLNTTAMIRAKAQMQNTNGNLIDVSVVDNTNAGALWATTGAAFKTGFMGAPVTQNLNAASGWTGTAYDDSQRAAAPFAILDTVYDAVQKVVSVDPTAVFPALTINWSPNNIGALGSDNEPHPDVGQIGTSHFEPPDADAKTGPLLYILGKADNDTDEYDRHVLAHEFGHYLQNSFSRDDTPGGTHAQEDILDMRVAFSEGWADGWSAIALDDPEYSDTNGPAQSQGFAFSVAAGATSNPGWFNEDSVQKVVWDLDQNTAVGFAGIWGVMKTGLVLSPAVTSMESFGYALAKQLPAAASTVATIYAGQSIALPADPYGSNETNFGPAVRDVNPLYLQHPGVGSTLTGVCVDNDLDPASTDGERDGNKLGEFRFVHVTLPAGAHTFAVTRTSSPLASTTPVFTLYGSAGQAGMTVLNAVNTVSLTSTLAAGDFVLAITDTQLGNAAAAQTCFNVQIN